MHIEKHTVQKIISSYNLYFRYTHLVPKIIRPWIRSKIFSENPKRNFDFYISLGNNCTAARTLKTLNLRTFSFPFDWLWGVPLIKNLDWILQGFKGFLNYEDLVYPLKIEAGAEHLKVKNHRTGTYFIHDFLTDSYDEFLSIQEKYNRRCLRLLNECKNKNVFFLYIEHNNDKINYAQSPESILKKLVKAKNKIGARKITLSIIHSSKQESNKIETLQTNGCSLYLFGSQQVTPKNTKDRHQLALLLKEVLQTIEEDTNKCSMPSLSKERS